jgi:hypothetical protein
VIIFASAPSRAAAFYAGLRSAGATRALVPRRACFAIGCASGRWWVAEFDCDKAARVEFARQNPDARFFEACHASEVGAREVTGEIRAAIEREDRARELAWSEDASIAGRREGRIVGRISESAAGRERDKRTCDEAFGR